MNIKNRAERVKAGIEAHILNAGEFCGEPLRQCHACPYDGSDTCINDLLNDLVKECTALKKCFGKVTTKKRARKWKLKK